MHAEPNEVLDAEVVIDQPMPRSAPERALTLQSTSASIPAQMIAYAMQKDAPIERLEQLLELQQKWEANEARKAYHLALADFKGEPLTIYKDKRVGFDTKDGSGNVSYAHATLGNVVGVIAPALAKHRLSHSWAVDRQGERIAVTCKLTHAQGHSESITLEGPLDNSGKKNAIQQQASTITYLERYTLLAITGLATHDGDDDGRNGGGSEPEIETITEEQAAKLQDALEATGRNAEKFKQWLQVDRLLDLPADQFDLAFREASKPRKASS